MTLNRFWAFLAVSLPVLASLIANLSSVDLTYHLRAGDEIVASRALPVVDSWTFTAAGLPWVDQQWGAQVVLASTYALTGWTGLAILRAALVGAIFGCVYVIGRHRGLGPRLASLLTLAAFGVSAVALALRPQLLGMAFFALVLLLLTDRHRHPARLWLIPLITVLWANMHGSFFLGPLVLGLAWLEDAVDRAPGATRVLLVALVSALAACITPFGPMVWAYAVGLTTNPQVTQRISEWQPTSVRSVPGILFFLSALAVVALIARRGRMTAWPTLLWLATFFLIGVYAIRGVAWWPIAAAAVVAGTLLTEPAADPARAPREDPSAIRRLNLVIAALIVVAGIALLPIWRPIDPGLQAPVGVVGNAPPGLTDALRDLARPDDRLLNPQPWGSWFEWAMPALPVAIDSRIELYPVETWTTYERVVAGVDGWQAQLDDWGVTLVVAAGEDGDAFGDRLVGAGWKAVYTDPDGTIYRRPEAPLDARAGSTGRRPDLRRTVSGRTALLESPT